MSIVLRKKRKTKVYANIYINAITFNNYSFLF